MKRIALLLGTLLSAATGFAASEPTSPPIGPPGLSAVYHIKNGEALPQSVVATLTATLGVEDAWNERRGQWLHVHAVKKDFVCFQFWLLCELYPQPDIKQARKAVLRYILQEGDASPREYRHAVTGLAVLPGSGAWPFLTPQSDGSATEPLPDAMTLLGHRYVREQINSVEPARLPDDARVVELRPDALMGVPHNTRQADETRRYDDSEYDYVPMTQDDFQAMIAAGLNCFRAEPDLVSWLEEAGVFYWGVGAENLPYPECLYRPLYIGPELFLDEPAVVTRDYSIRPRLREDAAFRAAITVQDALRAFEEHYAKVINEGAPTRLLKNLTGREDVDVGTMDFVQPNLYSWETMVASAAHQLRYHPETPGAIVFEPPGQLGTRRTLPAMNMSYGCQIPVAGNHFIDIIIGFLRGAARASGKEWGISIYGGVDRSDAPGFFARAYELGATRFFFWDNARLACVPFHEVLDLGRHVSVQAREYPHRDLERLRDAADVAILLPPGYNLGHVFMGKGVLWGLGELNLERKNREGVPYRQVMGNFFIEIERCLRLGIAFDLMWDLPGLPVEGYREIVHVREDGKVDVIDGGGSTMLDGARIPERPNGQPPTLEVTLSSSDDDVPFTVTAEARVTEGAAPIYYAPAPDSRGVHHNTRVAWELHGPGDEDYTHRAPAIEIGAVAPQSGGHVAHAAIHVGAPGQYRLRISTTDLAGRSTTVWKEITAR